ncbi:hypothetical protein EN751_00140 [Mesorhizobium sp. M4A.F.Ca.ET.029.04.2.1]|uniref:hypothetical protein n=1 Tax=Mesorhizobium sp. TaxID=1871066 RepID=UPI000FD2BCF9|nr:hypothetical protein [Mesorhizobium sp.]RVC64626.1 hypothetical protein EN779_01255 [Mesorhizobium sp. M4B.F.Ca.ET.088.02.2.1]RVD74289.1 hypothetical protein EN751_00140 [Mesorhizobium sp. M4A.F.Ca.ET.029.04.2.1]
MWLQVTEEEPSIEIFQVHGIDAGGAVVIRQKLPARREIIVDRAQTCCLIISRLTIPAKNPSLLSIEPMITSCLAPPTLIRM